ncbi:MAG: hypothetical protein NC037_00375 [Bacteroides sp.]|nr:hypothetical protein [Bacillota bacterium]MCM1393626.1 hypothetical protein [[Eubacterium] siraeum]MCM1454972.1 hypothetical protein [Bacteroides sp.]
MTAVLGKDIPYADIGALRRALRSDKDSFAYKKSHYAVRDYRQYERWKRILGKDNMPKNLADFQDLKYNNSKQFEMLNDYKFSIENGRMSPLVKFNDYTHMKQRIENEIIGHRTVNGVEIKSQSKHFIERVFGSVEQRRSGVKLEDIKDCLTNGEIKKIGQSDEGESATFILEGICKVSFNMTTGNLIQTSPD